tara:strand:+ start:48 stop:965 length:918 start_codon:yes stop_codon:yes gene_type:complete
MKKNIIIFFITFITAQYIPHFDGNRSMELLIKQCSFGPRYPESDGALKMKTFFINFLKPLSDSLHVMDEKISHPYKRQYITLTNFLARFNLKADYRIMLMAHWDTREFADLDLNPNNRNLPILGANDGASGVSVLLTIAEIIHQTPLINIGLDLLFVDGEDMGKSGDPDKFGLGTQAFSKNVPTPIPQFAICIDMVADHEPNFPIEQFSLQQAPEVVNSIWSLANKLGYTQFENRIGKAIMDDHYYLYKHAQIPAIDIIDFEYPNSKQNYWHTLNDIPENCSPSSLAIVGNVVTHFIYKQDSEHK